MRPPDISKSEWTVMEALWERAPQTAPEVTRRVSPATKWAENTVRTLLRRLVAKGALKTGENGSGTTTFIPAVERDACVMAEGRSFMERIFGGASTPLLVHFAANAKLTAEEVAALKKILDQSIDK